MPYLEENGLSRRKFLTAGAMVGLTPFASALSNFGPFILDADRPWFDPDYCPLPNAATRAKRLSARALEAQSEPRLVNSLPITGFPRGGHEAFDRRMIDLLALGGHVGMSISIAVRGQLVLSRGYGYLSSVDKSPALPTSPGYVGSITKPICAMTALTLVKEGRLRLSDKVVDILPLKPLPKGEEVYHPELEEVTVRMLTNHTSGMFNVVEDLFDRPYYQSLAKSGELRLVHGDISQFDLVRRGICRSFVSRPGAEYHYSGQALQVLGRIVEKVSGSRLDKAMQTRTMQPAGIDGFAQIGYLSPANRAAINLGNSATTGVFIPSPLEKSTGKAQSWHYERGPDYLYGNHWGQADACGGGMLSSVDLLRYICRLGSLFPADLIAEVVRTPRDIPGAFTGIGWGVSNHGGKFQIGHGGAFGGIRAFVEFTYDDIQYAIVLVGEEEKSYGDIRSAIPEYGRHLRDENAASSLWSDYGFHS